MRRNRISMSSRIGPNVLLSKSKIGNYCYIGRNCVINNTVFGNYCSIAPGVQIGGMEHSYWWYSTSPRLSNKCISGNKTYIGHDVWIGAGAIIKQGIKIGDGSVIGSLSFVNKDVPENCIVIGSPARVLKERMDKVTFKKIKNSGYWLKGKKQAQIAINKITKY